ncbi:class I SAM-dependent methyltransferase [Luedemannella helvata]|uniref:class I SAM-dependent methyltransferase n=1 Tax=Luedemannella helvata TaxID=349315 RepID=UPI0031CF07C2
MGNAETWWREQLSGWAVPEHILAAVAQSPWEHQVGTFARRADQALAIGAEDSPSTARAREALTPTGTVLDVGAGAGAASLPLAPQMTELIAVDTNEAMLAALRERADPTGIPTTTIVGRWPDVAPETPTADVVVCHHVAYNAPDLAGFAAELTRHARRRVVMELTNAHPMGVLAPLWMELHDLARPTGPTAADAAAVLAEAGLDVHEERRPRPPGPPHPDFGALVAATARRVCVPPERVGELAQALIDLGVDPADPRDLNTIDGRPIEIVTLWWDRPDV